MRYFPLILGAVVTIALLLFKPTTGIGYVGYFTIPLSVGTYYLLRGRFTKKRGCIECENDEQVFKDL